MDTKKTSQDLGNVSKIDLKWTFAIIVSRFNEAITERLLNGSLEHFKKLGFPEQNIEVFEVPGAFEIPSLCQQLCKTKRFDAIVTLGAVIRGETSHYDMICNESARALMDLSMQQTTPISYGILTCENEAQALARSGGAKGHKGVDSVSVVLELLCLKEDLS